MTKVDAYVLTLNRKYLKALAKQPLLTKSVTAGLLALLNELIASMLSKDYKVTRIKNREIRHFFSYKIIGMVVYGSLIITPLSDKLYGLSNRIFRRSRMSSFMKCAQILSSLVCIQPILSAVFTLWLSVVNNYHVSSPHTTLSGELRKILAILRTGLTKNYFRILRSSMVTSFCTLVFANVYLAPETWITFFTIVYFVLGTIQNTKVKRLNHAEKLHTEENKSSEI